MNTYSKVKHFPIHLKMLRLILYLNLNFVGAKLKTDGVWEGFGDIEKPQVTVAPAVFCFQWKTFRGRRLFNAPLPYPISPQY